MDNAEKMHGLTPYPGDFPTSQHIVLAIKVPRPKRAQESLMKYFLFLKPPPLSTRSTPSIIPKGEAREVGIVAG
jgi:hypothetical protein